MRLGLLKLTFHHLTPRLFPSTTKLAATSSFPFQRLFPLPTYSLVIALVRPPLQGPPPHPSLLWFSCSLSIPQLAVTPTCSRSSHTYTRMLTIKQPVHYGYKSVHDLPTPPSTSRPSPPLIFQEPQKPLPAIPRSHSPSNQPMSGHHRGLPPPAAMALSQPPPPGPGSHPPPPPGPGPGQVPPPSSSAAQVQQLGQLPAPPQWQASEESMRAWLLAKAEEEKRRQEELRLEQRRMEHDILRTSLQGGIPPPMVPVVFAGMGGGNLPQAALEWAQQFMYSQAQQNQHPQLLPPTGPVSPHHHRRDSQSQAAYGPYPGSGGVPSTPGSAQGPQGGFVAGYPGSPTRPRGYSLPPGSRPLGGSNLPTLNTNVPSGPGGPSAGHSHPSMASAQQERPSSPPIYFHHWQPPTSQAGQSSSNQPATPSGSSKTKNRS